MPYLLELYCVPMLIIKLEDVLDKEMYMYVWQLSNVYRSRALLGACAYNSTGRKYAPISEMRLITNIIIMTFLE